MSISRPTSRPLQEKLGVTDVEALLSPATSHLACWGFAPSPSPGSMAAAPVPTISKTAAMCWPRQCQGGLWIYTIAEELPSTKLDIGTVSCTLSRANPARRITLETILPIRHNSLHRRMVVLLARTRVPTPQALTLYTTLWTTPPTSATKPSHRARLDECGICGRLCEQENEARAIVLLPVHQDKQLPPLRERSLSDFPDTFFSGQTASAFRIGTSRIIQIIESSNTREA